jgi:hypothetical protein
MQFIKGKTEMNETDGITGPTTQTPDTDQISCQTQQPPDTSGARTNAFPTTAYLQSCTAARYRPAFRASFQAFSPLCFYFYQKEAVGQAYIATQSLCCVQ